MSATKATPVYGSIKIFPSEDYWVRETENDPNPFGPLNWMHAEEYARRMSMLNHSGLAQVITVVGTREGDPVDTPEHIEVVWLYRRGKALVAKRIATFISKKGAPPAP